MISLTEWLLVQCRGVRRQFVRVRVEPSQGELEVGKEEDSQGLSIDLVLVVICVMSVICLMRLS